MAVMAENSFAVNPTTAETTSAGTGNNGCTESVCIDANRVYDSCGDKDCLSDLRVFFTAEDQAVINNAINVRFKDVEVINVIIDLEAVPFHRGFYSVDMTFFFDVCLDVYMTPGGCPTTLNGLSIFSKRVILYGSEGNVKVFSSDSVPEDETVLCSRNLPKATVQVASPMALAAKIKEACGICTPPCNIPTCICKRFGGEIVSPTSRSVFVTIGMFTIVQIERNVQLLIPAYDFCIPEKECITSSDSPCEMFGRIEFPTDEFFPPQVTDLDENGNGSGGCGCCKK